MCELSRITYHRERIECGNKTFINKFHGYTPLYHSLNIIWHMVITLNCEDQEKYIKKQAKKEIISSDV